MRLLATLLLLVVDCVPVHPFQYIADRVPETTTPLSVTGVHGDLSDPAGPGGFFTQSALIVIGTGFDAATTLQLVAGATYDLMVTSVDAVTLAALLPDDLIAQAHAAGHLSGTLVVTSGAGSITRDIDILQGVPGPTGAKGDPGPTGPPGPTYSGDGNVTVTGNVVGLAAALNFADSATTSVKLPIVRKSHVFIPTATGYCSDTDDCSTPQVLAFIGCGANYAVLAGGCTRDPPGADAGIVATCPSRNLMADASGSGCLDPLATVGTGWGCRAQAAGAVGATGVDAYVVCLHEQNP